MSIARLAYLGPEGTYTHQAALRVQAKDRLPCRSIRSIFEHVQRGEADAGVAPGENVLEGGVGETLDALLVFGLVVQGEVVLPIEHCLVGRPAVRIQRIYSHSQALGQCARWLDREHPEAERVECRSTGEAVTMAAADDGGAAIAAGPREGLEVLARDLVDAPNRTRFFVVGARTGEPTGRDRSLVAFVAPHRPGSLHACLGPFAERGINLSRIESRPARTQAWTYRFVVEIEGHPSQPEVATTLDALRGIALEVRILGAWSSPEALEGGS